jgi:hypothetical protein
MPLEHELDTGNDGRNRIERDAVATRTHVRAKTPTRLSDWKAYIRRLDPAATFQDYATAIGCAMNITPELKELVDDFGDQSRCAVFAVRHGMVEGVWLDAFHHYLAIVFTQASGDPEDCVLITSFG